MGKALLGKKETRVGLLRTHAKEDMTAGLQSHVPVATEAERGGSPGHRPASLVCTAAHNENCLKQGRWQMTLQDMF